MADHSLKNELFRPAGGTSWKEPLIKSHSEAEPLVSRTAVQHCREGRPLPSCRLICWQLCRACPVLSELSGPIPMPLQPARGVRCASTDSTGSSVRSASRGLNRPFGAGLRRERAAGSSETRWVISCPCFGKVVGYWGSSISKPRCLEPLLVFCWELLAAFTFSFLRCLGCALDCSTVFVCVKYSKNCKQEGCMCLPAGYESSCKRQLGTKEALKKATVKKQRINFNAV